MSDQILLTNLPGILEKVVAANLSSDETVFVKLKGAQKEALVCTDRRVMIAKSGFMTGQMFGSDVFQLSYSSIASAEVKYRIISGYFEVSAGGMQNSAKSYWTQDRNTNPANAPNCVSLNSKPQANTFRAACSFIMQRIETSRRESAAMPATAVATDIASAIERLFKLKTDGALNQAEFDVAKRKLLSGN